MKITSIVSLTALALGTMVMGLADNAVAASSEFRMLGLAMHQETGRNIYLGATHLGRDMPNPPDLLQAAGPKLMEYRVVARRTSLRSLLGNMLLQSEVATGNPPSQETIEFADALLSAVKGSLYAGDSFEVVQGETKQIAAYLNGIELVRAEDHGIFDDLLLGWISESGPTTAFRSSIMRVDLDRSLLSAYNAHTPSEERTAAVTSWSAPLAAPSTDPAPAILASAALNTATADMPVSVPKAELVFEPESVETRQEVSQILTETAPEPMPAPTEPILLASADPGFSLTTEPSPEESMAQLASATAEDIHSLDVTEYSHRLAGFNTALIRLVYSKIKYPRRAVRREIEGALELDITMLEDGSLVAVAIAESSGHGILDGAAVEAAEQALADTSLGQVDPVAMAEYGIGDKLVVPVPVNFILQ